MILRKGVNYTIYQINEQAKIAWKANAGYLSDNDLDFLVRIIEDKKQVWAVLNTYGFPDKDEMSAIVKIPFLICIHINEVSTKNAILAAYAKFLNAYAGEYEHVEWHSIVVMDTHYIPTLQTDVYRRNKIERLNHKKVNLPKPEGRNFLVFGDEAEEVPSGITGIEYDVYRQAIDQLFSVKPYLIHVPDKQPKIKVWMSHLP